MKIKAAKDKNSRSRSQGGCAAATAAEMLTAESRQHFSSSSSRSRSRSRSRLNKVVKIRNFVGWSEYTKKTMQFCLVGLKKNSCIVIGQGGCYYAIPDTGPILPIPNFDQRIIAFRATALRHDEESFGLKRAAVLDDPDFVGVVNGSSFAVDIFGNVWAGKNARTRINLAEHFPDSANVLRCTHAVAAGKRTFVSVGRDGTLWQHSIDSKKSAVLRQNIWERDWGTMHFHRTRIACVSPAFF